MNTPCSQHKFLAFKLQFWYNKEHFSQLNSTRYSPFFLCSGMCANGLSVQHVWFITLNSILTRTFCSSNCVLNVTKCGPLSSITISLQVELTQCTRVRRSTIITGNTIMYSRLQFHYKVMKIIHTCWPNTGGRINLLSPVSWSGTI
jgi:hypothetical protein